MVELNWTPDQNCLEQHMCGCICVYVSPCVCVFGWECVCVCAHLRWALGTSRYGMEATRMTGRLHGRGRRYFNRSLNAARRRALTIRRRTLLVCAFTFAHIHTHTHGVVVYNSIYLISIFRIFRLYEEKHIIWRICLPCCGEGNWVTGEWMLRHTRDRAIDSCNACGFSYHVCCACSGLFVNYW